MCILAQIFATLTLYVAFILQVKETEYLPLIIYNPDADPTGRQVLTSSSRKWFRAIKLQMASFLCGLEIDSAKYILVSIPKKFFETCWMDSESSNRGLKKSSGYGAKGSLGRCGMRGAFSAVFEKRLWRRSLASKQGFSYYFEKLDLRFAIVSK